MNKAALTPSETELLAEVIRLRARNAELEGIVSAQAAPAEQHIQRVLNLIQEGVLLIDTDWRYLYINDAAERQAQRPREELLGRTVMECWPGIEAAEFFQVEQRVMRERVPARIDGRFTFPHGQERWFEWKIEPMPEGLLILTIDITEQKRAEQLLQNQEHILRTITNTIPALIWSARPDGYIDYLNEGWLAFTGMCEEQALGAGWIQALHPEDRAETEARWAESMRTGISFEVEQRLRGADGDYRWFLTRGRPVRETNGTVSAWYGVNVDITDQKAVEAALQRSSDDLEQRVRERTANLKATQERLQLAVQAAKVGLWDWDLGTNQVYFSPEYQHMLGYTQGAFANDFAEWEQRVHPDDLGAAIEKVRAFIQEPHDDYWNEFRMRHRDGTYHWILAQASLFYDTQGQPTRMLGSHIDVTTRKQAEQVLEAQAEALSKANAELTRALRLKDEFLAMMSHELRTPLNAVLGISEGLMDDTYGPLNPRQYQALERVVNGGRHLLGILSNILELTRIKAGTIQLDMMPVNVEPLCRKALQLVADRARVKEIRLLPMVAFGLEGLRGDERRLTQILVNLLDNAVKFTPAHGSVGLEVEGKAALEQITFTVWDTGIGITPEDMERLFRPFTQVDGRLARSYEGIGLGLTLVQRLTELHGGSVQVASLPGVGSRFTITLPWTEDDNFPSLESGRARAELQQAWIHPARVLVADDHEPTLELYVEQLTRVGCIVTAARTGSEALAQFRAQHPDIVLIDTQMPELDGLSVIRYAREEVALAATPIIALTSLVLPGDRERYIGAGANEYLAKPVSLLALLRLIAALLKQSADGERT